MGDLFFFLKCLFLTVVLVVLMQIRIGEYTLEDRFLNWAHESAIVTPLQDVAHGGAKVLRNTWRKLTSGISSKFNETLKSENFPGARTLGVGLERSQKVLEEQARKAKSKVEEVTE